VDERVSLVPEGGVDGEVEVAGFVDWAADLAGRLCDVVDQRVPATGSVFCGPGQRVGPVRPRSADYRQVVGQGKLQAPELGRAGQLCMVAKTITLDR
jgi:hypothetical protein